jgi:DNA (cytosine-5)-methyltransferase 1
MKEKSFRVDLTNRNSDFESCKITWSAILHKGSGRKAKRWEYGLELANELFNTSNIKLQLKLTETNNIVSRFYHFKDELDTLGVQLPDAKTFQKIFTRRTESRQIGPDKALKSVRNLIDKYFPKHEYAFATIKNPEEDTKNKPKETPLRIAAGVYACEFIAESVNKKKQ